MKQGSAIYHNGAKMALANDNDDDNDDYLHATED